MKFNIKKNVSLKKYSTFKIGGRADYFFEAKTKSEIINAIKWAKEKKIPFFVFGNGSNILFSDEGFRGLVIKTRNSKFKFCNSNLVAQAGCSLNQLILESAKRGLSGLEWAIGIPGTLGGAIYGNAGAFKKEIKDIIKEVEVYSIRDDKIKIYKKDNCKFGYRSSIFNQKKDQIILSAVLKLKKGNKKNIKNLIKKNLEFRKTHHPLNYPNIGCVFKNIPFKNIPLSLQKEFKNKNKEKFKDKIKTNKFLLFPSAFLIDKAGLKGLKIGGAKVSKKHPNFIVNFKNAKAKDVLKLIKLIETKIKQKFGLKLEKEIELVGF